MSPRIALGFLSLVLLALLLPAGCAMREASVQLDEAATLVVIGETSGLELQVADGPLLSLDGGGQDPSFEIEPGRNRVRVWRGGDLLVDRYIFLARGEMFEVRLP